MSIIQNMHIGIGTSKTGDYIKAVKEAIEKARFEIAQDKIDFALVFTTEEFGHALVLQTINSVLGPVPLLGCSSTAIISGKEIIKRGITIILFSLSNGVFFNAACVNQINNKTPLDAGEELGKELLYGCRNVRRNLSVIFSNNETTNNPNFMVGVQEKLGRSFPLIGATLSAADHYKKSLLYFGQEVIENSCCGILWGGKLNFGLGVGHGWQPLGKPHYITKASGNTIYEIDGVQAVNLYKEYFAKDLSALKRDLHHLSAYYPLGINTPEKNEHLLRSITSINDDGSLVFRGEVLEGSTIRLMIASKESCLLDSRKACESARKNTAGKKIKIALVLNSLSRYSVLGRMRDKEIQIIKNILGQDVPLAGIYTQGEHAPLSSINYLGKTYLQNNSIVILAIAE